MWEMADYYEKFTVAYISRLLTASAMFDTTQRDYASHFEAALFQRGSLF